MKIFIGMSETAGYFTNLTRGFRELGVECTFFCMPNIYQYYQEDALRTDTLVMRMLKYAFVKRCTLSRWDIPAKLCWFGLDRFFRLLLFAQAALHYDTFIFSSAESFFEHWYWDLPILKLLGKKVLFVFTGSDHRPPYLNGIYAAEDQGLSAADLIRWSRGKKARLKRIEHYADFTVGHHLSAHFHEKPFALYQIVGIPYPLCNLQARKSQLRPDGPLRILHAPSVPKVKGSDTIRAAVQNLKEKGYQLELIELTGRPNSEVLEEISCCAFVVDEVYSDARLAGLSTEAATFSKPTVVGGYADDTHFGIPGVLEKENFPPAQFCHPNEIEASIKKLIHDEGYRRELGKQAKRFVEERWSTAEVARRYLRLIQGLAPAWWFYDPCRIRYLNGYGLSQTRLKAVLRDIVKTGGVRALQLSDKPELEKLFVEFAREGADPCLGSS